MSSCDNDIVPSLLVELAKLAVDARVQGHGLGRRFTETALTWARRRGAHKVILLSSTKLQAALRLYERLGFQYGPLPAGPGYQTADALDPTAFWVEYLYSGD